MKPQGGGGKSESAQPAGGGEGYAVAALSDARNPLKETINPQLQTLNPVPKTYGTLNKPYTLHSSSLLSLQVLAGP